MPQLKSVKIEGFRSIKQMELELRPINVCIGANGAGKSNLIAFFKMINELMGGRLQQYIATTGRATGNLHFGPRVTPQFEAQMEFEAENGTDIYQIRMFHAAGDSLIFAEELISFHQPGFVPSAGIRDTQTDAAVLYRLKSENDVVYRRIVRNVAQVAPFFVDFDLEPSGANRMDVILNWRHRNSDLVFGPHQLSDGTLRAICLIALLQQPKDDLPYVIVVDEPELGLHPHALDLIASLFQSVSEHVQVLISTQSSTFVDGFEPEDIVVVEREGEATTLKRPDAEKLREWLEDYSLGEIWEKNVIGGGPH